MTTQIEIDGEVDEARVRLSGQSGAEKGEYSHVLKSLPEVQGGYSGKLRVRVKGATPNDVWSEWSNLAKFQLEGSKGGIGGGRGVVDVVELVDCGAKRGAAKVSSPKP